MTATERSGGAAEGTLLDCVIRGADVLDGTGAPAQRVDVGLRGERVSRIGEIRERAALEIDGRGLALAPGFIDVHTHDDFAVLVDPEMAFKVRQGVTTEVVGNCGMGAAPFEQASAFAAAVHPGARLEPWQGYAGYLAALDTDPASVNVAVLVGHGSLRAAAMPDARRAPDVGELGHMRALLEEGLAAGAVGYSSGLIYEPGRNATTDELVDLARSMAGTGALYATHMRDEGLGLLDSVREAIAIGERAGVPVQISHHKASGRRAWGLVRESLALIDAARARGQAVHADQYPYTAGSTVLAAVIQGRDELGFDPEESHAVVIASCPGHAALEGRSLAELGGEWGCCGLEAAQRVLERAPATWAVIHSMSEEDVRCVMAHPSTMIGSDGIPTPHGKPHPRLYGTFARVLGHYVRDAHVLSLPEAVHRMTGLPARVFGLEDRGVLREGHFADLVLFDPAAIDDVSRYEEPRRHPVGLRDVWVNGVRVVEEGSHTGARPGRALRRA